MYTVTCTTVSSGYERVHEPQVFNTVPDICAAYPEFRDQIMGADLSNFIAVYEHEAAGVYYEQVLNVEEAR